MHRKVEDIHHWKYVFEMNGDPVIGNGSFTVIYLNQDPPPFPTSPKGQYDGGEFNDPTSK